jgi:hypothetical protein
MKLILIENEGAIFRGPNVANPTEVWRGGPGGHWAPYTGKVPKPQEWGSRVTQAEADRFIAEV